MNSLDYDEMFKEFNSAYVNKEIKKEVILDKIINAEDKEIIKSFANTFKIKYTIKADLINKMAEENFEEI